MKILFWNLGRDLTIAKMQMITDLITETKPTIICFAEGTPSQDKCQDLVNLVIPMLRNGFHCFYSPLFYDKSIINNQYGWNRFGLKVFANKTAKLDVAFTFKHTIEEGRIIFMPLKVGTEKYGLFFIHGRSKLASYEEQVTFFNVLRNFIDHTIAQQSFKDIKKIIIVGDFNLEPWNKLLQHKNVIQSQFFKKSMNFQIQKREKNPWLKSYTYYFNPFVEHINNHRMEQLVGTFYNKQHTSLLDFVLFSSKIPYSKYKVKVITSIKQKSLFVQKNSHTLLLHNFDHLPITITLKK